MSIPKHNTEGYADPTAYEALTQVQIKEARARQFWPFVYVCSPYAGEVEKNAQNARRFCRFAFTKGQIPIAPHLLFPQFLDDTNTFERSIGMRFAIHLLAKCPELWVFGDNVTEGMQKEIKYAKSHKKTVRHFSDKLEEVTR